MSKENDKYVAIGCAFAVATMFIQMPLRGLLLYGILASCDAPTWTWVIFWIYLPVMFVVGLFRGLIEAIVKAD